MNNNQKQAFSGLLTACLFEKAVLYRASWVGFGAVCNSLSPGGVTTELNRPVMEDPQLWAQIMDCTPLRRWASPEEIAQWIWFLTMENRFCTGQDILVDGGEKDLNTHFIWPELNL